MKALVFHGIRDLKLEELPEPRAAAGEAVIEVFACGICGSDVHGLLGHSPRRTATIPLVMGHEFTGRIVALGEKVRAGLAPGQRVVIQPQIGCGRCRACQSGLSNICPKMQIVGIERAGGFARYVSVPDHRIFSLPDDVSNDDGTLVETLAVEVHFFRQMLPLARTVVVLGAGIQGLLAIQLARLSGASRIIATDVLQGRLEAARQCGATTVIRADKENVVEVIRAETDGWGADLVLDVAGAPRARQQGIAALAPGGVLGLIGLGIGETTLDFLPIVNRELTVRGSYCYTDDDFLRALELIRSGQVKAQGLVQHAPLEEGVEYFRRLMDDPAGLTKVLLKP